MKNIKIMYCVYNMKSEQEEENTDPSFFYFHCEKLKNIFLI